MKGITCCGDCGYYNWKKHKCSCAKNKGKPQDHFYADCPLPDAVPVVQMTDKALVAALGRLKVETGSLACLGCGHEHNCRTMGCAIIRAAHDRLAVQQNIIDASGEKVNT